ncbi:hypothetical protein M404DRAFT_33025 [Pisolithus tinctorius Marx 270]|uniref:Uncharacterized protein n=1 Tax=Pisolithus tinctorius Marx 270 TaxID=870435 RepID=A0A0C3N6I8_PISTI|nr:hypothetical protein M404DRAFT_33025 [Pisolithus tinctorius Marx 270]
MDHAYEELTAVLGPSKVTQWELDALEAERERGEALDIYLLKGDKAPTMGEVQLKLMKNPPSTSANLDSVAWLAEGICYARPKSRRRESSNADYGFY